MIYGLLTFPDILLCLLTFLIGFWIVFIELYTVYLMKCKNSAKCVTDLMNFKMVLLVVKVCTEMLQLRNIGMWPTLPKRGLHLFARGRKFPKLNINIFFYDSK